MNTLAECGYWQIRNRLNPETNIWVAGFNCHTIEDAFKVAIRCQEVKPDDTDNWEAIQIATFEEWSKRGENQDDSEN